MSKVKIEIDTKTGLVDMSVDGEKMENVHCINVYSYERCQVFGEPTPHVEVSVEMKAEKMGDNFIKLVRLVTANSNYAIAHKGQEKKVIGRFLWFQPSTEEDLSEAAKTLLRH